MSLLHSFKNHKSQLNIKTKNENIELNCKTIIISKNKNLFKKKKVMTQLLIQIVKNIQ